MSRFYRSLIASAFLLILIAGCFASASAKTVEQWLEGFDTGETWFGEDFAYDITDEEACW